MAKLSSDVEIPLHWDVVKGEKPGTIMLRLRHKSLSAVKADGIQGGKNVLLVLSQEMATSLANDLLGPPKQNAPTPHPDLQGRSAGA